MSTTVSKNLLLSYWLNIGIWWVCQGERIFLYLRVIVWVNTMLNHVDAKVVFHLRVKVLHGI